MSQRKNQTELPKTAGHTNNYHRNMAQS